MRHSTLGTLAVLVWLAFPSLAFGQKQCKKGIPCGRTCIAANKTCHVTSSATSTTKPAADTATAASPWVASKIGKTYYKAGCAGANRLVAANRISFKSEADARLAGYHRSTQKGC